MKEKMLELVRSDLQNEYTHMLFYLQYASLVRGLHRNHIREWLEHEAESEMNHVLQFSKLFSGLGGVPLYASHALPRLDKDPGFSHRSCEMVLDYAIHLEQEVCCNYAERLDHIEEYCGYLKGLAIEATPSVKEDARADYAAWTRAKLFYEDQLEHSHEDLDELRELRKIVSN